jgi:hypothetical protein
MFSGVKGLLPTTGIPISPKFIGLVLKVYFVNLIPKSHKRP